MGVILRAIWSQLVTLYTVSIHLFTKTDTVEYPEVMPYLAPRYRGRIVLTRDPDGEERCVACNLCAVACPVDCIALQQGVKEDGRWYRTQVAGPVLVQSEDVLLYLLFHPVAGRDPETPL